MLSLSKHQPQNLRNEKDDCSLNFSNFFPIFHPFISMKRLRHAMKVVLLLSMNFVLLRAQSAPPFTVGVYGAYNLNFHNANFDNNSCLTCAIGKWGAQQVAGYSIGGLVDVPLGDIWALGARVGFSSHSVRFTQIEKLIISNPQSGIRAIELEHSLRATLSQLNLEALVKARILSAVNLEAGLSIAPLVQKDYESAELLLDNEIFFVNGTNKRNQQSGTIPEATALFHAFAGIEANLALSNGLALAPFARYYFPLANVSQSLDWRVAILSAGVAVRLHPALLGQ
jgi:Outer membrane protein beta-barrel domain